MTPLSKGPLALNREALSTTYSHAPLLRTRPEAKRTRDEDDGPVRIRTPVDAPACPTVGANYRRLVTADAMGMAKEGDRPRLVSMVPEARVGTNTVKHHDVPRFGGLRRDNTPSLAEPTISNNSGYNECSLRCMRGRRRGPLVTTLSLLSLVGGSVITMVPSSHTQEEYPGFL